MNGDRSTLDGLFDALGYRFSDPDLLENALTHTSAVVRTGRSNERLEFVGDRVLGLVIADALFRRFPDEPEGDLALRLTALVNGERLAEIAGEIGLTDWVIRDAGSRDGAARPSVLADACEAVIGAVYLDGGLDAARQLIERLWGGRIEEVAPVRDPKTALQEWAQGRAKALPSYKVVDRKGPPHAPVFTVEARVDGLEPVRAKGGSKREAERGAAEALLAVARRDD